MLSASSEKISAQLLVSFNVFSEKTITVYFGFSNGKNPQNQPEQISEPL